MDPVKAVSIINLLKGKKENHDESCENEYQKECLSLLQNRLYEFRVMGDHSFLLIENLFIHQTTALPKSLQFWIKARQHLFGYW